MAKTPTFSCVIVLLTLTPPYLYNSWSTHILTPSPEKFHLLSKDIVQNKQKFPCLLLHFKIILEGRCNPEDTYELAMKLDK